MNMDGNCIEHDSTLEKVLGYKYNSVTNNIHISSNSSSAAPDPKRGIFSQNSSIFLPNKPSCFYFGENTSTEYMEA